MRFTRRELLYGAAALSLSAAKKPVARPSVVLIVVEDVGAWMLGAYGNKEILTPNIDLLAKTGVRFSNSYSGSGAAAQGRAVLLTGQSPHRLGFTTEASLPASLDTRPMLSDILAGAGYQCGYSGASDLTASRAQHAFKVANSSADFAGVTAKATEFLDAQKPGTPFFLLVHYKFPGEVPAKYAEMYAKTSFDSIGWDRPASNAAANNDKLGNIVESIRKAAASMSALDDQVRSLIAKLDERSLRDSAVTIFTGSNGALLGRHGLWGDARASEPPNLYEEVASVPLIWQWSREIPPEAIRPEFVSAFDFLPTLCGLTGAAVPGDLAETGRSYLPAVVNTPFPKKQPWRSRLFGEFGDMVMLRDKRYKLVLRAGGKGVNDLYEEIADPRERVNQYENPQFITIRGELSGQIAAWTKTS
jgi:arylsulfatase A-like enzyme